MTVSQNAFLVDINDLLVSSLPENVSLEFAQQELRWLTNEIKFTNQLTTKPLYLTPEPSVIQLILDNVYEECEFFSADRITMEILIDALMESVVEFLIKNHIDDSSYVEMDISILGNVVVIRIID